MTKPVDLVIVFADLVESTRLYELLGDDKASATVTRCMDIMIEATEQAGGKVLKTMGDEVMATFQQVDDAFDAASAMQQAISEKLVVAGESMYIRVGCHCGPVMLQDNDIFGGAVHIANRMVSQAKPGQIVTTAVTVARVSDRWRSAIRQIDLAPVRGRSGEIALFEVLWKRDDVTSMLPTISWSDIEKKNARLVLRYRGQEVVVSQDLRNITIGRAEDSSLVVRQHLISRLHARIEYQRGRFLLIDQSTNGTYVVGEDGEQFVRREHLQLRGEGVLGFGRPPEPGSLREVMYSCKG